MEDEMSIDRCSMCDAMIDTDYAPESYREELNDHCICEKCHDMFERTIDEGCEGMANNLAQSLYADHSPLIKLLEDRRNAATSGLASLISTSLYSDPKNVSRFTIIKNRIKDAWLVLTGKASLYDD